MSGKKQAGNRAAVKHIPVILIHGNAGTATSPVWGWQRMREFLKKAGYNDAEIWGLSYLGPWPPTAELSNPHRDNINAVRKFIDEVRTYLGQEKVILIGHSLGAGLSRCYLLGLEENGKFNANDVRFGRVKGLITISAGNYGLGKAVVAWAEEFKTGSRHEQETHRVTGQNVIDDTPFGLKARTPEAEEQHQAAIRGGLVIPDNTPLPAGRKYYNHTFGYIGTACDVADTDPNRIFYAALTSKGDLADVQLPGTSYLQGADINLAYDARSEDLPKAYSFYSTFPFPNIALAKHEWVIKDEAAFKEGILPILVKCNPEGSLKTP